MFLRSAPTDTLGSVIDRLETDANQSVNVALSEVSLDVAGRAITLGDREVALTTEGLTSLGSHLDVPSAFLLRQDAELQQTLLSYLLGHVSDTAQFVYSTEGGLVEVLKSGVRTIPIPSLLHVASRVIDPTAPVRDFWADGSDFRLDVYAPEGFDRGIGGDIAVGDVSAAGVRLSQDRKHNLAPQATPFQYRYFCTNGMTTRHEGSKIDARGASVEEVLAQFESLADVAFRQAEADMAAFYEMRQQRVDNPERTLLRMGQDAGLAPRVLTRLMERVPSMAHEAADGNTFISQFDLVNLITNEANDPTISRVGTRDILQATGGSVVVDHADRCGTCQSRLVH